jgi:prepilin-type N-terminal cleavage/methylation domain-containing protein
MMRLHRPAMRRGFTLAELMVGMMLSVLVITALYNMFVTVSYVFNSQSQVSATQLRLRSAMEQVKDDLRRAGLMSTPNSERDTVGVCPPPAAAIYAVGMGDGAGESDVAVFQAFGNDLSPDTLLLSGNFTSSGTYPSSIVTGAEISVNLPPWGGPEDWEPAVYSSDGFDQAFVAGQLLRLTNAYGSSQFLSLASVDAGTRTLTLTAPPRFSVDGLCGLTGSGDQFDVNPVQHILYRIEPREPGNVADLETDLVRQYWDPVGQEVVDKTDVVVGQNIVDFQVWFTVQDPSDPAAALLDDGDLADSEGPSGPTPFGVSLDGEAGSRPELVRVAGVRICARSDREDPRWLFREPAGDNGPLIAVNLNEDRKESARVACLTSEVEVVNLTLRNL